MNNFRNLSRNSDKVEEVRLNNAIFAIEKRTPPKINHNTNTKFTTI